MNKKLALMVSVLVASGLATGCGTPGGGGTDSSETIKVAVIPPSSGALAQFGIDIAAAWTFAADEVNAAGGLNGRKIELIRADTDGSAATTLRVAREAVTRQGAKFIGGVVTSTENGALNAQLQSLNALSFNALGKDDGLIGKDCNANAFHVVPSTTMDMNAIADSLSKLPGDRWAIQAVDYSTGHTAAKIFRTAAEKAGKTIVLEQFAPLNTTEFGTYISKIADSDADALFAVEFGADGIAFVNQSAQFNLTQRFKTVLGYNMVSEPLFKALGNKVVGFYNNVGYDVNGTNALNTAFVKSWEEKHGGTKPYFVVADNYLAAQTLFHGIKKAGSGDPAAVRDALKDTSFDSIVGTVKVRGGDHQLIRPSYLGQVAQNGTGLEFKIIAEGSGDSITPAVSADCKF